MKLVSQLLSQVLCAFILFSTQAIASATPTTAIPLSALIPVDNTQWTTGIYRNHQDISKTLSIYNARFLDIHVSGETEYTQDNFYIYDQNGKQLKKFTGTINTTFTIKGNTIKARLLTDGSTVRSGITVRISQNNEVADSILVRFSDNNPSSRATQISQLAQTISQKMGTNNTIQLSFNKYSTQWNVVVIDSSVPIAYDIIYNLIQQNNITHAEPNIPFSSDMLTTEPNDPDYINHQWHYKSFESESGINLPQAWDITTGAVNPEEVDKNGKAIANIVVAVIDGGITKHPDLIDNILKDKNGDIYGYDFRNKDSNPVNNAHDHSTAVAGIIAAKTNNGQGIAGVNWQAKILPIQIFDSNNVAFLLDLADAIVWAAGGHIDGVTNNLYPADVINLSLSSIMPTMCTQSLRKNIPQDIKSIMQNAIDIATSLGSTVVGSAGNKGKDVSQYSPANCDNIITVGGISQNKKRSVFATISLSTFAFLGGSNIGKKIDISAPAGGIIEVLIAPITVVQGESIKIVPTEIISKDITSLGLGSSTHSYTGTSFAAPHISGVVSLMLAQNPDLTPAQVKTIIKKSVNSFPADSTCISDVSSTNTNKLHCGTGVIDAYQAVINSKTTLLSLNAAKPVNKSEYGQTLYKFKYLDKDGYSGVRAYNVNFEHTAARTNLYIKKNGIPNPQNSNSYNCHVLLDGRNEIDNEDSVNTCLQAINLAYGDLLYIATKASGVASGDHVGNIMITKTHPPLLGGSLSINQAPLYYGASARHGNGDLKFKFTLIDVIGSVTIKIYGIFGPNYSFRIPDNPEQCTASEQGSCSIEVIAQHGDKVALEVKNTGNKEASYKIAIEGESTLVQTGSITIAKGYDNTSDWWSYTHRNVASPNDGGREAKMILSDFTDINNNPINADLDLYTKKYQTDTDISNNDISKTNYDCRPYYGKGAVETCKTTFYSNKKDNISERVRVRIRGYYASDTEDKVVKFKLTTKTSRRTAKIPR